MDFTKTIAAVATPPGQGGISVIRISGSDAFAVAEKVFVPLQKEKKLAQAKGYTALYGSFFYGDNRLDEGIALIFRAPHSYTGENVVELSCHGGMAVTRLLLEACLKAGAVPAGRGEFTRRAFENGKLSLTQAEAVMDLISAGGRQGAALAQSALQGSLAKLIGDQQRRLTEIQAHLAAWVDFPEEDVPELSQEHLQQVIGAIADELQKLMDGYEKGAILRQGIDCAIVGRPNVGKSTLLNRLSGFERAIVTPVAGTTRDVVEQAVQLGDLRLNLFDTAGLRQTEDIVEAEGIRRSHRKLQEAGLILAVFDGSEPLGDEDRELCRECKGKKAVAIVNKSDCTLCWQPEEIQQDFDRVLLLSAKSPESLAILEKEIGDYLGTSEVDPYAASLSGQRQLSAAARAREALVQGLDALRLGYGLDALGVCVDDGLNALYELTGENAGDAVIDTVFERFCVGK